VTNKTISLTCPNCGAGFNNAAPDNPNDSFITCPYCSTTLQFKPTTSYTQQDSDMTITIENTDWIVVPRGVLSGKVKKVAAILIVFAAALIFVLVEIFSEDSIYNSGKTTERKNKLSATSGNFPIVCSGKKNIILKNKKLVSTHKTIEIRDKCALELHNVTIHSHNHIGIRTRGNATVLIKSSKISGEYRAMVSTGSSRIKIVNSTFTSPNTAIVAREQAEVSIIGSTIAGKRFSYITKNSGKVEVKNSNIRGKILRK
jgi:DNA-directed RNA polymerase subunit RPC12/RpoP